MVPTGVVLPGAEVPLVRVAVVLMAFLMIVVAERAVLALRASLIFAVAGRALVVKALVFVVAHRAVAAMPPILVVLLTTSLTRGFVVAAFVADVETLDATSLACEGYRFFLALVSVALRLLLVPARRRSESLDIVGVRCRRRRGPS